MAAMAETLSAERQQTSSQVGRVLSVDVLRGLTLAFMILVNDPGDWGHVFRPLDHAEWNGWTPTDLVFPTFLFCMGASLVFSLGTRAARGDCRRTMAGQILLRGLKLLGVGLLVDLLPLFHWQGMRIYGVLFRLALCYTLGGLLLLWSRRTRFVIPLIVVLLLGYYLLLRFVPVPGFGMPGRDMPFLDEHGNLTAWMDRGVSAWLMAHLDVGQLYRGYRDPEGLLSTLPAVASVLLGALAGMLLRRPALVGGSWLRRTEVQLAAWGAAGVAAGTLWSHWFPINKNLWTSSFVLLAAGFGALVLALGSSLVDGRRQPWPGWLQVITWPWLVFGSNAIVALLMSDLMVKLSLMIHWQGADGKTHSPWGWMYQNVFARGHSTEWTSLAFAIFFVAVCFLPNWALWRRKVFVRL